MTGKELHEIYRKYLEEEFNCLDEALEFHSDDDIAAWNYTASKVELKEKQ